MSYVRPLSVELRTAWAVMARTERRLVDDYRARIAELARWFVASVWRGRKAGGGSKAAARRRTLVRSLLVSFVSQPELYDMSGSDWADQFSLELLGPDYDEMGARARRIARGLRFVGRALWYHRDASLGLCYARATLCSRRAARALEQGAAGTVARLHGDPTSRLSQLPADVVACIRELLVIAFVQKMTQPGCHSWRSLQEL